MAGVQLPEVPGCKELLEQEIQPELDMSKEAVEARLAEYERLRQAQDDRFAAEVLGGPPDDEKEAPTRVRKARAVHSSLFSSRLPFGEPTPKKLRSLFDTEFKEEGKESPKMRLSF